MTVPCMTYSELVDGYLRPNGFDVEDPQPQDFWGEHDRIMVKKGDLSFPLQFRKKYFYLQVVILFNQLAIPVPEDHQKCYDQHMALDKAKADRKKTGKSGENTMEMERE